MSELARAQDQLAGVEGGLAATRAELNRVEAIRRTIYSEYVHLPDPEGMSRAVHSDSRFQSAMEYETRLRYHLHVLQGCYRRCLNRVSELSQ